MNKGIRAAVVLLAVICLGIAAYFGWKIISAEAEYAEGDAAYEQLSKLTLLFQMN